MRNIKLPQRRWVRWLLFTALGIFSCLLLSIVLAIVAVNNSIQRTANSDDTSTVATLIPTAVPTSKPTTIPTLAPTVAPTATVVRESSLTVDEYLTMMVPRTLGQSTNYDEPRFVEVQTLFSTNPDNVGDKLVIIRANKNLENRLIVGGMLIDAVDYYSAISENPKVMELDSVTILFTLPMVDKYGNTQEAGVNRIKLTTETMKKINWSAFKNGGHRKFVDATDSYVLNAALR
jgi:hypothetical protein